MVILISVLNNVNSIIFSSPSIIVNAPAGSIEGSKNGYVTTFYEIPFAQPPVGELRWVSPQEITESIGNESNPYDATSVSGIGCPHESDAAGIPPIQSEDCLYLNIFAPYTAMMNSTYSTNYTVMIWIYGGSFKFGWGTWETFNPTNWVDLVEDVIIVTFNYRIGALGFFYDNTYDTGLIILCHNTYNFELILLNLIANHCDSLYNHILLILALIIIHKIYIVGLMGNYGQEDQAMAIKWVYDNIAYFGGNPDNINIFGESAGAYSVGLHLLYNQDYIASGIMQSIPSLIELRTPDTWYNVPTDFTRLVNCTDYEDDSDMLLDCWRNVSFDKITYVQDLDIMEAGLVGLSAGIPWSPTVGTDLLPDQPMWGIGTEETPPFMIGTTGGEGYFFMDLDLPNIYDVAYGAWLFTFQDAAITESVLEYYGVTPTNSITGDYRYDNALMSSDWWRCSIRYQLEQLGDRTDGIYYYNFDVVNEAMNENVFWITNPQCVDVACHFVDVFYIFLNDQIRYYSNLIPGGNTTIDIGEEMQRLWSNYAKTLNANDAGDGEDLINLWPEYSNDDSVPYNFLDMIDYDRFKMKSTNNDTAEICAFWNSVGYAGRYTDPNATPDPTMEPTEPPTMEPSVAIVTPSPQEPESIETDDVMINKPQFILCVFMSVIMFAHI